MDGILFSFLCSFPCIYLFLHHVAVYVDLEGVGSVKDQVKCHFTKSSFDLEVFDLQGKNFRLIKDNLDKVMHFML